MATQRLRLEPLTREHLEDLVALDADPEVLRHIWGRALTRDEVVERWLPVRTRPDADARGLGYWAGRDLAGEFLGWWCLALDDDPTTAELGYRLHRAAWGRGYATEGSRALLEHAFATLGLASVWAETMAVNARSRAVMEKLGLTHEATRVHRWEDPLPGAELGEVTYRITREGWVTGTRGRRR
ncbi:GNAT family N-acetyltransferase [Nocardioides sp. CBS4Y-1]|uniref:GNAT family N-acetyltransferase n=1 Tax=Nocardioides acrostichi TaxID=2784339 RepID=A0A930YDF3_9ACTN|nr:GNAT family N-acetyltransferase [Nocardioides acrostichi]